MSGLLYNRPDIPLDLNLCFENEIFKDITDDIIPNIRDYYMISNYGRIYHKKLGRFMKTGINDPKRYQRTAFYTNNGDQVMVDIHRLEMKVYNYFPGCEKFDVNHKDGNKSNNHYSNLEWLSRSENIKHAYDNNLHPKGEESKLSKISEEKVVKICRLLSTRQYTNKEIADIVGCKINIVSSIKQRKSWMHISNKYNFYSRPGRLFTDEQIHNICSYFQNVPFFNTNIKIHSRDALIYFGYPSTERYVDTVRKIYTRKYSVEISKNYDF